jgi:ribosomal-protein-alanine N-acetyltransferase
MGWLDNEVPLLRGFLVGYIIYEDFQIADLAVDPTSRRKGIGRSLLVHALEEATQLGAERALLEVRKSNEYARNLYMSLGFSEIGCRRNYYSSPNEDAIILQKWLINPPSTTTL